MLKAYIKPVPFGSYQHHTKPSIGSHQKHDKARVCHRAISQSNAIALVYWYLHLPCIFFCVKKYKKILHTMQILNPLQAAKLFCL
jgi:hypothetical protein